MFICHVHTHWQQSEVTVWSASWHQCGLCWSVESYTLTVVGHCSPRHCTYNFLKVRGGKCKYNTNLHLKFDLFCQVMKSTHNNREAWRTEFVDLLLSVLLLFCIIFVHLGSLGFSVLALTQQCSVGPKHTDGSVSQWAGNTDILLQVWMFPTHSCRWKTTCSQPCSRSQSFTTKLFK